MVCYWLMGVVCCLLFVGCCSLFWKRCLLLFVCGLIDVDCLLSFLVYAVSTFLVSCCISMCFDCVLFFVG